MVCKSLFHPVCLFNTYPEEMHIIPKDLVVHKEFPHVKDTIILPIIFLDVTTFVVNTYSVVAF